MDVGRRTGEKGKDSRGSLYFGEASDATGLLSGSSQQTCRD